MKFCKIIFILNFFIFNLEAKNKADKIDNNLKQKKIETKKLTWKDRLKNNKKIIEALSVVGFYAAFYAATVRSIYYYNNYDAIQKNSINKKIQGKFLRRNDYILNNFIKINVSLENENMLKSFIDDKISPINNIEYKEYLNNFYNLLKFEFSFEDAIIKSPTAISNISKKIIEYIKNYFQEKNITKINGNDFLNKLSFIYIQFKHKTLTILFDFILLDRSYEYDHALKLTSKAELKIKEIKDKKYNIKEFNYFDGLEDEIQFSLLQNKPISHFNRLIHHISKNPYNNLIINLNRL